MTKNKSNGHATVSVNGGPEVDLDAFTAAAAALSAVTENIAAETLTGDIRDFILDRLKNEHDARPWNERSEGEQRDTIASVEAACDRVIRRAVELIAAAGQPSIKAAVEQVVVKDGIKAVLTLSKFDPRRHHLVDAQGASVLLIVADVEAFTGQRAKVEITPDQGDLERVGVVHSDENADRAAIN